MKTTKFKVGKEEFFRRNYKEGDENVLIPLANKIGDMSRTLEFWNWKHKKNPNGFSIVVITNKNGEIIGQTCHLYKRGYYYGKNKLFYVTGDVGISGYYRGKGLVRRVVFYYPKKYFLEFGFPNEAALKSYYKIKEFGNYKVQDTYYLSKKYNFISHLSNFVKHRKNKYYNIINFSNQNKQEIDNLWNKKKKEIDVCVIRDFEYLNWRILQSPDRMNLFLIKYNNETIGYFSVMIKDKICYITDILILNKFINKGIINYIERFCLRYNIREIRIFITDEKLKKYFFYNKFLFVNLGTFVYYNNLDNNYNISPYLTYIDMD